MQPGVLPLFSPVEPAPEARQETPRQRWPEREHLWLCIDFPDLPLDALAIDESEDRPPVVVEERSGRTVILCCSSAARRWALVPGMPLSSAYALCHDLQPQVRDLRLEVGLLERLACRASRYSSTVSLQAPRSLLLEIKGSLRLFGGLQALHDEIRQELDDLGCDFRLAVAPTSCAAWWLARNGRQDIVEDRARLRSVLGGLPLAGLNLDSRQVEQLAKSGLNELGDVIRLPRDGLARRFGHDLLTRLDRALGVLPDARKTFTPPVIFDCIQTLPLAVDEADTLLFAAQRLLLKLESFLRARDAGVNAIECQLIHEHGSQTCVRIGLSALSRSPEHCLLLLKERLDRTPLPAPVIKVRLLATEFQAYHASTRTIFSRDQATEGWWQAIAQIQARLGHEAVRGLQVVADHRPEHAWRHAGVGRESSSPQFPPRPLWLLEQPRQLAVKDGEPQHRGALQLERGPERIEQGWWDGNDISRDYYHAVDTRGAHLWIFRERRTGRWFLHGFFA
ncbi:MAG: Y-family DNA polymerase [Gammaproteobacteria bacterium]